MSTERQKERRERIAIAAMQGILASCDASLVFNIGIATQLAVECADLLIKELDKEDSK